MKYATLRQDDVRLNTSTIRWPENLDPLFDIVEQRVFDEKAKAEIALAKRVEDLTALIDGYMEQVDSFALKSDPLKAEVITHNVEFLDNMAANIVKARAEADSADVEESLLQADKTQFMPQIQLIESTMAPFNTLWKTTATFYKTQNEWLNGSFNGLDADDISGEITAMWRATFELTKQFAEKKGGL